MKQLLKKIKHIFIKEYWEEQRKVYGIRNIGKKIYIIRNRRNETGLMSCQNYILRHIQYALKKGWIPVVDMKNYSNMYQEKEQLGLVNTWEYYYNQPTDITLDEAYKSFYVILSSNQIPEERWHMESKEDIAACYNIIKQHMQLNENTFLAVKEEYKRFKEYANGREVIGVCCRGTDYTTLRPSKHCIPLSAQETINILNQKLNDSKKQYMIYLATEDQNIYEEFLDEYGKQLFVVDCPRFQSDTNNKMLAELSFQRDNDKYLKGLEYLKTVYLLSKCDLLIAHGVGATLAALRMNGNHYKDVTLLNNGFYE